MLVPPARKNKVVLSDYNYARDIENRLLLASLSTFEVEVLREILNGSLKTSLSQLADTLDTNEKKLVPSLEKLSKTKLFHRIDNEIIVNKEMRKYFEFQILKFEEDFEPGMEFLQGLLSKVPIHILPTWYSISRTSDHIFHSIVEKYLLTPRIYERYLYDLHFDEPIIKKIGMDVLEHPELKMRAKDLMEKYNLKHQQFEEYMLHLEYNFVSCLNYQRTDNDHWEEIVVPFAEWREYLSFIASTTPKKIHDVENIKRRHPHDFGFVKDMTRLLAGLQKQPLPLSSGLNPAKNKDILQTIPHILDVDSPESYLKRQIQAMERLQLAQIQGTKLIPTAHSVEWMQRPLQDQAICIYRHHLSATCEGKDSTLISDRDIREIERSLKRVINSGWVMLEDFIGSFISPIGNAEQVMLRSKGKKWKYSLPAYGESEHDLVRTTISDRFFEAGMVATGVYKGQSCFCVTPFGRMSLED